MAGYGALTLVPPLLAIGLAIRTRKAVPALFLGIWSGAILYAGGPTLFGDPNGWFREVLRERTLTPQTAFFGDPLGWGYDVVANGFGLFTAFEWITGAVADSFQAQILVFTLLLGSGVAMIWNLGGSYAVRDWALERLQTRRGGSLAAMALGLVIFFDDYANTAIVGSTIKDVSDQLGVSREKLSYIVDSTAAPVATLAISSWIAFQLDQIENAYDSLGLETHPSAMEIFLQSIPFNMYAVLAIVMVFLVVWTKRDYGEMLDAERRATSTGDVFRDDAQPMQDVQGTLGEPHTDDPRLVNFFAPIAVLLVVTLGTALWTGTPSDLTIETVLDAPFDTLYTMVIEASFASALIYGSFAMVATGFVLGHLQGSMDLREATDVTIDGFGIMLTAVTILVLAWGIGTTVGQLGTGEYVASAIGDSLPIALLPAVVLVTAAFIAFSTGTAWGTMGIITPIAIPVAWTMTGDHTMSAAVVGMVFSGAIFGDHSSPISDTTVLSATFTGADLVDHVRTQIPYALTVGGVATLMITVWGITRITPIVLLAIGAVLLVGLLYGLSEFDARRKGVDPVAANDGEHADGPIGPGSDGDVASDGGPAESE
ncbi:Na+/H+ antiporter NhaC family protein [Halovivax cerinus]|uniref:Na+/H+ antiporter NhaC family protein n=1 Tax=Halovivax cerinus TaxID=1487865 RepID=A0ABD5NMR0_9EURY|nr:Na+/H+ antiporter NhaC family protein [Halovivax cerinus]